jgi:hypothetical protein
MTLPTDLAVIQWLVANQADPAVYYDEAREAAAWDEYLRAEPAAAGERDGEEALTPETDAPWGEGDRADFNQGVGGPRLVAV